VPLVDPEISRRKLDRELAAWAAQAETYRQRGYFIVARDDLTVDVGFMARLPIGAPPLAAMAVCARFDFADYDVRPPSVVFIDFFSGAPVGPPVGAFDFRSTQRTPTGSPPNLLIGGHPKTKLAFLCHVGVREYHEHHEHDGDDWLLYRNEPFGTLDTICDLIWRTMTRNVVGLRTDVHQLPAPFVGGQLQLTILQGDVDAQAAALHAQAAALHAQAQAAGHPVGLPA
jgi:hypothetical protein